MKHHSLTSQNEFLYRDAVKNSLSQHTANIFLDIGGGSGQETLEAGESLKAKTIISLDHDIDLLNHSISEKIQTVLADANYPLPFHDNSIDLVLANQLIEHIAKTDSLTQEIYRILKPNGKVIVCTPNLASWHNIGALTLGFTPFSMQISDQAYLGNPLHPQSQKPIDEIQAHLRVFTHHGLKDLFLYHGFTNIKTEGVGFYPLPNSIAPFFSKIDPTHSAYILLTAQKPNN